MALNVIDHRLSTHHTSTNSKKVQFRNSPRFSNISFKIAGNNEKNKVLCTNYMTFLVSYYDNVVTDRTDQGLTLSNAGYDQDLAF